MFKKQNEYQLEIENKFKDKITCLSKNSNRMWIGREDGIIESHNRDGKFQYNIFEEEYDYLESEEIKPNIVAIDQMSDGSINDIVFVGNEKNIKILKIRNDTSTIAICNDLLSSNYRITEDKTLTNIHSYVLNSISINSSRNYMVSADYIKVNLWKPDRMDQYFNLIDLKSQLHSGVVFVINSCKFHPFNDDLLLYSSSNGEIYVNDISITPNSQKIDSMKNNNTNGIKSISDFSFIDSNLIISRSLNNICLFDMRNTKSCIFNKELITDIDEQNKLNSSDAIYEKFKISTDGIFAYTGSYFNTVYSINVLNGLVEEVLIDKDREFGLNNKIKLTMAENSGFTCAKKGTLISFVKDD